MLDIKLFLWTWERHFQGLSPMLICLLINLFPMHSVRVKQICITVYFSVVFLLSIYGFPVLAISKVKTVIAVTPFPLLLHKNSLGQLRMG